MKPKLLRMLALSPVPEEGAGCRFRIAQYVPALEAAGVEVTISPFFTREFFDLVYRRGHHVRKAALFARRALDRVRSLFVRGRYDILYIYREGFPVGPPLLETLFARTPGLTILYDFDDAVFLPNTSEANRPIAALKWPSKVRTIVSRADAVIAGNEFLADYARRYSDAVRVIPTCVDTAKFVPRAGDRRDAAVPVIGWIGTPTTAPYLQALQGVLQELARTRRFVLRVCGAGSPLVIAGVPGNMIEQPPWTLESEVALFNTCDIGVYPLTDDEWARGKCGLKAIQFMSCGVPVVAAPVGVNRDIVEDGVNGLLASTPAEWGDKLRRLIDDPALRATLGRAGRRTIDARYSLSVNAPAMVDAVLDAVDRVRSSEVVTAGVAPLPRAIKK